jgi:hypothetical protein
VAQPLAGAVELVGAQVLAAMGVAEVVGWLVQAPVASLLSPLACLVVPGLQALAVVYVGDRMGAYRSHAVWAVLAAYAATAATMVVYVAVAAANLAFSFLTLPLVLMARSGQVDPRYAAAVVAAAVALWGVNAAFGVLVLWAAPLAAVAAYHVTRRPKAPHDTGEDLPSFAPPPPRPPPVPFTGPHRDNAEEPEEDR